MNLNIIPQPASVQYRGGGFYCTGLPKITGDSCFEPERAVFREQMKPVFPQEDPAARITLKQAPDRGERQERYTLTIAPEGITVEAGDNAGMYHGLQVLRQLFMTRDDGGGIPCAVIEDYPRFPWRGLMLDCSRHFFTVEFIKKLIDALSLHHLNTFHWHLSDDQGWRLPVSTYPLLTEIGSKRLDTRRRDAWYGGFYTTADITEIVAWAACRHVEVVPEIDLPGHTSSVLAAYPGLGCTGGPYRVEDRFGVFEDVLCAGNDGLWDLAAAVFDTLGALFPSQYVHIGGDEVKFTRWAECPKCQARMQEWGVREAAGLQARITEKLAGILAERGKIAIGWDEVIDRPEEAEKLPKELVVMSWRGRAGGNAAAKMGHPVIMTPNSDGCYFDYKLKDSPEEPGQPFPKPLSLLYALDPVSPGMSAGEAALVLGAQGNLWTEYIYASKIAEYMIFPRLCALAEVLWSPKANKNFADFTKRLTTHNRRLESLGILYSRVSEPRPPRLAVL
ncbi:MAG: beta-N-acetylhexosaminidase [Treponema sp.]|jgi:hexosaminidase|nr:beta-N-acetylhexosaminidase [Treponema sp.]